MSGLRELLAHLGGVALFAIPGFALTGLFPGLRATPWLRRLGFGHLLGIATVAGTLYALSALLGVPIRRPAIFATAAVLTAAGLAGWWRARGRRLRRPLPLRARLAALLLALVGAGVSAGLFADAMVFPLRDWDGRMHWAAQARYIRFEGSVLPLAVVRGQWYINHPRYPVLLPVAQAAVLEATGAGEDELFFRGLYASFLPAFLLVLYDGARRWAGWLPAGLVTATAAGIPFLTFVVDGGATGCYSDLPLACFYGAALVLLLRGRVFPSDGIAAGLLLGAALLTKNEGTILAVFGLLAAALGPGLRLWRARRGRSLAAASRRRDAPQGGARLRRGLRDARRVALLIYCALPDPQPPGQRTTRAHHGRAILSRRAHPHPRLRRPDPHPDLPHLGALDGILVGRRPRPPRRQGRPERQTRGARLAAPARIRRPSRRGLGGLHGALAAGRAGQGHLGPVPDAGLAPLLPAPLPRPARGAATVLPGLARL